MTVYNSLGSNYNLKFLVNSFFSFDNREYSDLIKFLEKKYQGKAVLTYKGREAIRIALKIIDKKGSDVAICGFTCFAVADAIKKESYGIEYLDIEKDSLNFSAATLERAIKKNPKIKAVIIQNTLGYPCGIEKISEVCRKNKIILIEDLAHSIGAVYKNKKEAGSMGDFAMLSFSQDKVVDNVSGGALIVRNNQYQISNIKYQNIKSTQQIKDRSYPILTFAIRKTYELGLGKPLHFVLKKLDLLSMPMRYSDQEGIHLLPIRYVGEIYNQFQKIDKNLQHRRKIAGIYSKNLNKKILSDAICKTIDKSANLRFPIFVQSRGLLLKYLSKSKIFISDIWYDAPIGPKKYLEKTDYIVGSCPNSEYVSKTILNLPTHINISEDDAYFISKSINQWLKLQ